MKQKLVVLVHKYDNSMLIVKTQADLSVLLGVSVSTIKRKYCSAGVYETDVYVIYVDPKYYENNAEKQYNRTPSYKIENVYLSNERAKSTIKEVKRANEHQVLAHSLDSQDVLIKDERDLSVSEYEEYYSQQSLESLNASAKYYKNTPLRMKYISKYGELRQQEALF